MGNPTPIYDDMPPHLKVEFELFLVHIKCEDLDRETLKANYLKRSPKNKGEDFESALERLFGNNTVEIKLKEVEGGKKVYYTYATTWGAYGQEHLEKLMEMAGFIKVIPKKYEILVE